MQQRLVKDGRSLTFCWKESVVANTHRQSIILAHYREDAQADIYMKITNHFAQDSNVLCIFLPKVSDIGTYKLE